MKELLDITSTGDNEAFNEWDTLADDSNEYGESERELGNNAQLLAEMLSPEGTDRYKQEIESEISQNPALAHMKQIDDERTSTLGEFLDENGVIVRSREEEYFAASDEYRARMKFAKDLWGEDAAKRYNHLARELDSVGENQLTILGEEGRGLLEHILGSSPEPASHAAHTFVPSRTLDIARSRSGGRELTIAFNSNQEAVDIPINYFVSAEGMESWYGRGRGGDGGKISGMSEKNQTSLETIKEYSEAETTPPPVENMSGFVLPDGRIYFKSFNAHRVAAAIRRGDESMQFRGEVTIFPLDYFPSGL